MVAAAVAGGMVAALHMGKVPPALPAIRAELDLGLVAGGFVISLFNLLGLGLAVFIGSLADRLGRLRLVSAGFLCLAAGGALGALATGLPLLLAGRFVEGVGFVAVSVAMPAIIAAAATPHDRPVAISLWSIYTPTGMAAALVAAPAVLALVGWRGLWLGIMVLTLTAGVMVWRAVRGLRLPPPPSGRPLAVILESLTRRGLVLLALAFGGYALQWVSLMVWLPTFLTEALGMAGTTAALATALVVLVNVPGNLAGGWLLRRGWQARWLVVGASLVIGTSAFGIFLPGVPDMARLGLCLVFSLVGGLIPASLFASVPGHARTPGHLGAANGMLMQGSSLGQFAGAPLVAASVAAMGGAWEAAIAPMAGAALLAGLAGWAAARPSAPPPNITP